MEVVAYRELYFPEWDKFVLNSKNGHFMFLRNYMDYHKERFTDASLLIYKAGKLLAVFPANMQENVVYSHQGLTFGSLIMSYELKATTVIEIFNSIISFYQKLNIIKIIYKAIPYIYHLYPAEEDLYALYTLNAQLIRRDISSTVSITDKLSFIESRKSNLRKAIKNKLHVEHSYDFEQYWQILEKGLLARHECSPTHALNEIKLLAENFPDNIKLFVAYNENKKMLSGVIIYLNHSVVHTQYMISSEEGKKVGALDFIIHYLINEKYIDKKWFDFGISTENNGQYLNEGLIFQKESFGGRAIAHDFYLISIDKLQNKLYQL